MAGAPILEIAALGKILTGPQGEKRELFRNVSVQINTPAVVVLLGASGQGKSTLLRILGRLDRADEGTVRFYGRAAEETLPQEWRKKIAYVAQFAVMLDGTVEDNLRAVSVLHRKPFDSALARELMMKAGLGAMEWSKRAAELSGGEKQRVALIRSLLLEPELLLLDEITASLDTHSKQAVEQLLLDWHKTHGTLMLWVTHDLEQAKLISDDVWYMDEHTLLEASPSSRFFTRPDTRQARRFLQISDETEV